MLGRWHRARPQWCALVRACSRRYCTGALSSAPLHSWDPAQYRWDLAIERWGETDFEQYAEERAQYRQAEAVQSRKLSEEEEAQRIQSLILGEVSGELLRESFIHHVHGRFEGQNARDVYIWAVENARDVRSVMELIRLSGKHDVSGADCIVARAIERYLGRRELQPVVVEAARHKGTGHETLCALVHAMFHLGRRKESTVAASEQRHAVVEAIRSTVLNGHVSLPLRRAMLREHEQQAAEFFHLQMLMLSDESEQSMRTVLAEMERSSVAPNTGVMNALLSARGMTMTRALDVMDELERKGALRDTETYIALLKLAASDVEQCDALYLDMLDRGIAVTPAVYDALIEANKNDSRRMRMYYSEMNARNVTPLRDTLHFLIAGSLFRFVPQYMKRMRGPGREPNADTLTALLQSFALARIDPRSSLVTPLSIIEEFREHGVETTVYHYTQAIKACHGHKEWASKILLDMKERNVATDVALCRIVQIAFLDETLSFEAASLLGEDDSVRHADIAEFVQRVQAAQDVTALQATLSDMKRNNIDESEVIYQALSECLVKTDDREARELYTRAKEAGMTMTAELYGLSASFCLPSEFFSLLAQMERRGFPVDVTVYNEMIRRTWLRQAEMLLKHMKLRGVFPNATTYGFMLRKAGTNVPLLQKYLMEMKQHAIRITEAAVTGIIHSFEGEIPPSLARVFLPVDSEELQDGVD